MTPRLASILATATLATITAPRARAEDAAVATEAPPPTPHRIEARIGMLVGGGDVGDVTGPSSGLHVALGARYGEVTGMAEYDYLSIGDAEGDMAHRHGNLSRAGVLARCSLFRTHDDGPIAGDYWAEAGVGYEHVSWDPG